MHRFLPDCCRVLCYPKFLLALAGACCLCAMESVQGAVVKNLAPTGSPLMGAAANFSGSGDVIVANQGPISEVNDGVINTNLAANGYQINADGQIGMNGNGADTYAGGVTTNPFDFVGVLFDEPQFGISSVNVQNYLANDGGWWGPTDVISGGNPLSPSDLTAPLVQITSNGGVSWTTVAGVSSNYVTLYTGVARGTGFPDATSGPLASFSFFPQNGINGIRLLGNGAGPADGNGFIGVNEFEVIGIAQDLALEVNLATGMVRLTNDVHSNISLDFYQITSASLSLNIDRWNSLENPQGNPANFPSGNGSGNGWEELGNLGSGIVAESFLQGSSALAPGESVNLGFLFEGGDQDLMLRYRTASGQFCDVAAISVEGSAGDFDWDNDVDGADFLAWQRGNSPNPGSSGDLAAWQANYGAPLLADVGAVIPEPNSVALLISAAALAASRSGATISWLPARATGRLGSGFNGIVNKDFCDYQFNETTVQFL